MRLAFVLSLAGALTASSSWSLATELTADDFRQVLSVSSDGHRYDATRFAEMSQQLSPYGLRDDEIVGAVREFTRAGYSQTETEKLALSAARLSYSTKTPLYRWSTRLARAFSGNVDDVRKLDKDLDFLSADQLRRLRELDAAGKRPEMRAAARDALTSRLSSITPR